MRSRSQFGRDWNRLPAATAIAAAILSGAVAACTVIRETGVMQTGPEWKAVTGRYKSGHDFEWLPAAAAIAAAILSGVLGACTVMRETGVMQLGPDTYRVAVARAESLGGETEAHKLAMVEAEDYCQGLRQEFVLISGGSWNEQHGGYVVDFRCATALPQELLPPPLGSM